MSGHWGRFGAVSALALATALGTPALAQDASTEPAHESVFTMLGRIILGAGRARVAIETPQAVTALEAEDLEREQASTPGDLLRSVPGVEGFGNGLTGQFLNIRGIGTSTSSDENRVVIMVDGVQKYFEQYRVGSNFGEPDLYRRVEVLRGPGSSLLYSSGAIGGVVAFETRDASDFLTEGTDTAVRVRAGYNSNGGGYSGSVIFAHRFNERVEILAALTTRYEGEAEGGAEGDNPAGAVDWRGRTMPTGETTGQSALLSGRIALSDESEQTLRFSLSRFQTDGDQVPYSAYGNFSFFGTVDRNVTDDTAQITWENPASDNPWIDARIQLSWTRSMVEQENASMAYAGSFWQDSTYAYEGWALNARNTVTMEGENWQNYLTIGAQYSSRDRITEVGGAGYSAQPGGEDETWGVFVQNEFILNDRLTLLAAARYDRSDLVPTSGVPAGIVGNSIVNSGSSFSLAAHYQISDAWAVFGSVARTTRLPTIDEVFDGSNDPSWVAGALRPERARTYELGFSWQGRDVFTGGDGLDIKVTAFNNDIQDMITRSGSGVPFTNVGLARIRGVELEASYQSELWFGRAAASVIDAVDRSTGAPLASAPTNRLMLEIGRRLPQHNIEFGWRGTFMDGMVTASGDRVNGVGVHDLFVTWRPDSGVLRGAEVQFAVNNVFDTYYYNALDVGAYGYAYSYPADGRDVRLTLARTFNF